MMLSPCLPHGKFPKKKGQHSGATIQWKLQIKFTETWSSVFSWFALWAISGSCLCRGWAVLWLRPFTCPADVNIILVLEGLCGATGPAHGVDTGSQALFWEMLILDCHLFLRKVDENQHISSIYLWVCFETRSLPLHPTWVKGIMFRLVSALSVSVQLQ